MQQDCGRNFFVAKSYAYNKKRGGMHSTIYPAKRNFFTSKKTRSRLLWIAIAVIGIAAVISAVCVAGF